MKTKKVTLVFLENANAIQITTIEQKLDFITNRVLIKAYFDGAAVPSFQSDSGRIICETGQRITTAFDVPVLGHTVRIEITGQESVVDQVQVIQHFVDPVTENDYWLLSAMITRFKDSVGFVSQFWSATYPNRAEVMQAMMKKSPDHFDVLEKWMIAFVQFRYVERDMRSAAIHEAHWKQKLNTAKSNLDAASIELKQFCINHQIQIADVLQIAA